MNISDILDSSVLQSLLTSITTIVGVYLREKFKKTTGLTETADRIKKVNEILSEIQYEMNATRVQEWIVTNGDKTLSGHSVQKLSMFCEFNKHGVENVAGTFQFVPASNLSRNIIALAESKSGYTISNEYEHHDDLAALHQSYGMQVLLLVKVTDLNGKWTGIMFVGFDEHKEIQSDDIAFAKLKASQIGAILK
jgi:hypothetical protein